MMKKKEEVKRLLAGTGRVEQEIFHPGCRHAVTTTIAQNSRQISFSSLICQFKDDGSGNYVFVKSMLAASDDQRRSWSFADAASPEEATAKCIQAATEEHLRCCERLKAEEELPVASVAGSSISAKRTGRSCTVPLLFAVILLACGIPSLLTESTRQQTDSRIQPAPAAQTEERTIKTEDKSQAETTAEGKPVVGSSAEAAAQESMTAASPFQSAPTAGEEQEELRIPSADAQADLTADKKEKRPQNDNTATQETEPPKVSAAEEQNSPKQRQEGAELVLEFASPPDAVRLNETEAELNGGQRLVKTLPVGTYVLDAEKQGYKPIRRDIDLHEDQQLRIEFEPLAAAAKKSYELSVFTNVDNAKITLNDASYTKVGRKFTAMLPAGPYSLLAQSPGYADISKKFVLRRDGHVTLTFYRSYQPDVPEQTKPKRTRPLTRMQGGKKRRGNR